MAEVKLWMNNKKLKLNEGKTECMMIGTRQALEKFNNFQKIYINNKEIEMAKTVKNLGFVFDQQLTLRDNVHSVIKTANYHIRNIAFIKRYLDVDSLKMLVNNYVITRLDYCNSLYHELPAYLLKGIQRVFNRAARLIVNKPPWERITPVLIGLHWLPVKARIIFKICVLTYLAVNEGVPKYLKEHLVSFSINSEIVLRHSADKHRLLEPRANLELGKRAYEYAAPRLYNSLPNSVKESSNVNIFRKKLKTYIFEKCFDLDTEVINVNYKL